MGVMEMQKLAGVLLDEERTFPAEEAVIQINRRVKGSGKPQYIWLLSRKRGRDVQAYLQGVASSYDQASKEARASARKNAEWE